MLINCFAWCVLSDTTHPHTHTPSISPTHHHHTMITTTPSTGGPTHNHPTIIRYLPDAAYRADNSKVQGCDESTCVPTYLPMEGYLALHESVDRLGLGWSTDRRVGGSCDHLLCDPPTH